MIQLRLRGTPSDIINSAAAICPEVQQVLAKVRGRVAPIKPKREIYEYQAACLYVLARQYNWEGARILEIGTALGYSAAVMASAAPLAAIVTLNPKESEVEQARGYLTAWPNVKVEQMLSWDYLSAYRGDGFDLIFVDGDHAHVSADLPWWFHVKPGGLFLFHDYSPENSGRPCPPVYQAINDFSATIDQLLNVCIVDDQNVGLAGFYRMERQPTMTASSYFMRAR